MLFFANDSLFPDWSPFDPIRRILSIIGLSEEEISLFRDPFEEFRHQRPDSPLRLPEDIRSSEDWFRSLFGFGENSGRTAQINLDNIGRDFLCLIYYRQRVLDLFREGGISKVLTDLFVPYDGERTFTNLNNTLTPVEALTDFLVLSGYDLTGSDQEEEMIVLSDLPQRHLTLREVPPFVPMLRTSSNLSRYIRNLSTCCQDGGKWEDLIKISHRDYNLDDEISLLSNRKYKIKTGRFGRDIALSREFCLWDIYRGDRLPSIRTISEVKGIPYLELLRILRFGDNNGDRGGVGGFEGLNLIRSGFTGRIGQRFLSDIESRKVLTTE